MCSDYNLNLPCVLCGKIHSFTSTHLCFAGSTHRHQRNTQVDVLTVALGDSLILNCTYNCSGGFLRGCWSKPTGRSDCSWKGIKKDLCTVSLHLPNVTAEDLEKNLTCFTENTDHVQLLRHIQRTVLLQLHGEQTCPNTNNDIALYKFTAMTQHLI